MMVGVSLVYHMRKLGGFGPFVVSSKLLELQDKASPNPLFKKKYKLMQLPYRQKCPTLLCQHLINCTPLL